MQNKKQRRSRPWFFQGLALVLAGILMLWGAIWLIGYNREESDRAGQASQDAMVMLESMLETVEPVDASASVLDIPEATAPLSLPRIELNGDSYVGYLVIPSLDRELPVMELKYLEQLQVAPCLQTGSPHEDNAVICAHNYPAHFGPLRDFKGGEEINFVDLNGVEIRYAVTEVKTISPEDTDAVLHSSHDLVLYTCTQGGQNRVMIACDRTA